ncbi:NAD(P)H-hydrate dehydratase [Pedobacter nanyangensis]|uniref:NAD(P)H-hydrate dehydratase n=1 Tax=Pedobacter nanyangensis TaxID=1562389 RepID=UPI001965843E|nr:NAD(P)H-hydrate dehydratase [Pedobacter nanyangensis]
MKNLLTASQIKAVDAYTIQHQPIASIDLMEKAALAFVAAFARAYPDRQQAILVACGQGNNGGDGLAIARILAGKGFSNVRVLLTHFSSNSSADYKINLERLKQQVPSVPVFNNTNELEFLNNEIVIDALIGAGLNKLLTGAYAELVALINASSVTVVSVDVPTGFSSEGEIKLPYQGIKAALTISFQLPKINFFFPESAKALKKFKVVPIGLDEDYIQSLPSDWKLITHQFVGDTLKPREKFSHKGTYGHALILAGHTETMGAALLATGACLHSGVGLVTASIPQSGLTALNVSLPEAMFLSRNALQKTSLNKYQAVAVGPGLGVGLEQTQLLEYLLAQAQPLILDADALNIIAAQQELLKKIPQQSIITPHLKEFDRLFGEHQNWWDRVETARQKSKALQMVIVLKNQYTFIALPSGEICINLTGNPAMAQGGMGDVLTGMITGFMAQGYTGEQAAILGVYLHGKTGDTLAKNREVISASTLSKAIPKILNRIK